MKRLPQVIALICSLGAASLSSASSTDAALNKAYIEGFLAGAQLTDREIIRRLDSAQPEEKYSDFFKRAFSTRVGNTRDTVPATFYAGFCLPDNVASSDVVSRILATTDNNNGVMDADKAARIFQAIRTQYPCQ